MRPQSRSTRKINTATYSCISEPDSQADKVYSAKKHAEDQGGKIGHSYNLIKGFSYVALPDCMNLNHHFSLTSRLSCSVDFPEDSISTLESHEHVKAVEKDQVVKTQ